ncbi:MAG: hypothetical protein R2830_10295 [Saprospiraceae bacterium]
MAIFEATGPLVIFDAHSGHTQCASVHAQQKLGTSPALNVFDEINEEKK